MADGLSLDPAEFDPGPLATRGQVHTPSGTNIATVVGLTPGSFADVTGPVFFGLNVAGPAAPFFMTATQATAVLNLFTPTLQGLVPASGGGTTNFLRADGSWAPVSAGHGIRDNGVLENQRSNINLLSTTSIIAAAADDAGNDETEMTWQRAALTGAISAGQNVNATQFAGIRDNGTLETARGFLNCVSGTNTTFTGTQDAGNDEIELSWSWNGLQARRNSGTLLTARRRFNFIEGTSISVTLNSDAADDENEVTIAYNGVIPGAVSGAVTHAAGGGNSVFSGIRVNGSATTDRTNLNFENTVDGQWTLVDDAANDEIEINFTPLGSFYSENSVGSFQTRFISFDDSTMLDGEVVDNTGGSGFINVSFELKPQAAATVIGVPRGGSTSIPIALSGTQVASIARFNAAEALSLPGVNTGVAIGASTTSPRWTNGGATSIVLSITAPAAEGQLLFPEVTTGGGDEVIFVEDTAQAAGTQLRTPGGIPYRFGQNSHLHPMFYHSQGNTWGFSGPPGGDHGAILEINEHFDFVVQNAIVLEGGSGNALFNFTSSNHSWAAVATGAGTSATVGNIDNELHHRGILRLTTTNQNAGDVAIYIGRDVITGGGLAANEAMYDCDQIWRYEAWVRIPSGQTTSFRIMAGFFQDPSDTNGGTEFIGFAGATDGATSTTNWVARCRAASTNTELNSGVAFSNAVWHKLEWFRFDEFVLFYVNRVYVGVITANVPNGNGTIGVRVETLTAAARQVDCDRIILHLREAAYD